MFCRFCNAEVNDKAKFCTSCAKPLKQQINSSESTQKATLFYYIIGAFFILGGILPYLLLNESNAYQTYLASISKYGAKFVAAASSIRQFCSILSPAFYFSSSMLAIYTGFLLLKWQAKPKASLVVCASVHGASILYSGIVNIVLRHFPKTALSLFTNDDTIIVAGMTLLNKEPEILSLYQNLATMRCLISALLIGLSIAVIYVSKRQENDISNRVADTSALGSICMIISLPILSIFQGIVDRLHLNAYEASIFAAHSFASSFFSESIRLIVLLAFVLILAASVFFDKAKRRTLFISVIGMIAALGFVGILLSRAIVHSFDLPTQILPFAIDTLNGRFLGSASILISMFCWFHAIYNGKMPAWIQITWPVLLPLVFVATEFVTLYFIPFTPYGLILISVITVVLTLFARTKKNK